MSENSAILLAMRRYKLARARALGALLCVRMAGTAALSFGLLFWADRWFVLGPVARTALLALALFAAAGVIARAVYTAFTKLSDEHIARSVAARIPELDNYLLPAVSFARRGVPVVASVELAAGHMRATAGMLEKNAGVAVFPARITRGAAVLLFCGLIAAGAAFPAAFKDPGRTLRVLLPFKTVPAETYFMIAPGDAVVPRGGSVIITINDKTASGKKPLIEFRAPNGPWLSRPLRQADGGFSVLVERVSDTLQYRVLWRDLTSRTYTITPRDYPALADVGMLVTPPAYAGQAAFSASPQTGVQALAGSLISVYGKAGEPLASAELMRVVSAGDAARQLAPIKMRAERGSRYTASFAAEGDMELWFRLISEDGWTDPSPLKYTLRVIKDNPPAAAILSPSYETEASPGDAVAVVFEAADDIGLESLALKYDATLNDKPLPALSGTRQIRRFPPPGPVREIGDSAVSLAGYPDGARITLILLASDGARNVSASAPAVITVRDYSARHTRTETSMINTESLLEELAHEYEVVSGRLSASSEAFAAGAGQDLNNRWNRLSEEFERLLAAADDDTFVNEGVRQELRTLDKKQDYLRRNAAQDFNRSAQRGEAQAPQSAAAISKELKRMAARVAEQRKFQFYKDFETAAYDMADSQDSLENILKDFLKSDGKNATDEEWKQLEKNLSAIQRQLDELNSLIESMPDPRTIDGNDERRVHQVPLNQARDAAAKLMEALKSRDFKKAAQLAKALSEQLARMRKVFEEAAGDVMDSGADAQAQAEMDKFQARLDDLAERQSRALAASQGVAEAQAGRRAEVQRRMLEELAACQSALYARAVPYAAYIPPQAIGGMNSIAGAIRARQIDSALGTYSVVKAELYRLSIATPAVAAEADAIRAEQDAIGAELAKLSRPPVPPTAAETQTLGKTGGQQSALQTETDGLAGDVGQAGAQDVPVPPGLQMKLGAASAEMSDAVNRLAALDSEAAAESQARALKLLEEGRDELSQSRQQMSSRNKGYQSSGRGKSGSKGRETSGRAKLPSSEDYLPPAAIREKAMQSMRENYPQNRGGVIKEYLRKLSQ